MTSSHINVHVHKQVERLLSYISLALNKRSSQLSVLYFVF